MLPPTLPSVSLIVVNYEAAGLCTRLVESLVGQLDEIIVVDNASSDVAELEPLDGLSGVRVVRLDSNRGFGAGSNAGRACATGDVLIVANPDVTVSAVGLRRLAAQAFGFGIAGPRFRYPDGRLQRSAHRREPLLMTTLVELCAPLGGVLRRVMPDWHPTLFSSSRHHEDLAATHLLGALLAIDRRAWDAVGGFDEAFFLYREETDLCVRAASQGWRVRYLADVEAEHIGGASSHSELPLTARPAWLKSHYAYIEKHRGRRRAALARIVGTAASAVTMLQPKRRASARVTLAWHLERRRRTEVSSS
jgi:hypothetical protein